MSFCCFCVILFPKMFSNAGHMQLLLHELLSYSLSNSREKSLQGIRKFFILKPCAVSSDDIKGIALPLKINHVIFEDWRALVCQVLNI